MRPQHSLFESISIEWPGGTTGFSFSKGCADGFQFSVSLLLSTDQIADIFAVVGVMSRFYLSFDPMVLLVSHGYGFSYGSHGRAFFEWGTLRKLSY